MKTSAERKGKKMKKRMLQLIGSINDDRNDSLWSDNSSAGNKCFRKLYRDSQKVIMQDQTAAMMF